MSRRATTPAARPRSRSLLLLVAVAVASTGSVPAGTGAPGGRPTGSSTCSISLYLLADGRRRRPLGLHLLDPQGRGRGGDRDPDAGAAPGHRCSTSRARLRRCSRSSSAGSRSTRACAGGIAADRLRPGDGSANRHVGDATGDYRPQFATGPVLVVVALVAIAVVALVPLAPRPAAAATSLLPESLAAARSPTCSTRRSTTSRAEADPRRAVIAAYARMERALARLRPPAQPVRGAGRVPAADLRRPRREPSRHLALDGAVRMGQVLGTRCGAGDEAGGDRGARGGARGAARGRDPRGARAPRRARRAARAGGDG